MHFNGFVCASKSTPKINCVSLVQMTFARFNFCFFFFISYTKSIHAPKTDNFFIEKSVFKKTIQYSGIEIVYPKEKKTKTQYDEISGQLDGKHIQMFE